MWGRDCKRLAETVHDQKKSCRCVASLLPVVDTCACGVRASSWVSDRNESRFNPKNKDPPRTPESNNLRYSKDILCWCVGVLCGRTGYRYHEPQVLYFARSESRHVMSPDVKGSGFRRARRAGLFTRHAMAPFRHIDTCSACWPDLSRPTQAS